MMQIIDCDQGSAEWHQARAGIPTASMFAAILKPGKGGAPSVARQAYMNDLAGEIITGEVSEAIRSHYLERGHAQEPDARRAYAFMADVDPMQVGFIRNGPKGASPDSLVGADGAVEIKSKKAGLLVAYFTGEVIPDEHKAQCQGVLWVAEREWIDFVGYCPKMPLFVKRAYRDETFIRRLADEVDLFNEDLAETVERVRRLGIAPMRAAA